MFTSPHLLKYNERIRLKGREAADSELIAAFERIEAARGATTLTFFEYNTLAAPVIFADRAVDVALLEVGLGGRLDATNLVAADVAVLVSVGFDHSDWLGGTLDLIGAEKAGIFRAGRPAVLGTPEMPASVSAAIESLGARAVIAERDFSWRPRGRALPGAKRGARARTFAVIGVLADKDAAGIAAALAGLIDHWILCTLPGARGSSAGQLAQRLGRPRGEIQLADSVTAGCELARAAARPGDRVVVFGSVHTVGPALEWLRIY